VVAALEASHAAYEELAVQHRGLQERRRHEEHEGREVATLFRKEMTVRAEELAAAQAAAAQAAAAVAAAEAAAAEREAELKARHDAECAVLVETAAQLQAQLESVMEWRQLKEAADAEMARLRQENQRIVEEGAEKVGGPHGWARKRRTGWHCAG